MTEINQGASAERSATSALRVEAIDSILKRDSDTLGRIMMESSFRIYKLDPSAPDFAAELRELDAISDLSGAAVRKIVDFNIETGA